MPEAFIVEVLSWAATYLVHSSVALAAAWIVTRALLEPHQRLVTWRLGMVGGVVTTTVGLTLATGPTWHVASSTITSAALVGTVAWLVIGAALFATRVVRSRLLVARLRREVLPAEASFPAVVDRLSRAGGLSQLVQLSVSENLSAPVVLGQREVCFPRRLVEQLSDTQLEAVIAHELAHVHRRDRLWLWVVSGFETLCFPQVMNRVAARHLAVDTELVCDDWAAQRTGQRRALAEGLAIVASWMTSASPVNALQPSLGVERSPLLQRVERLLAAPHVATPKRYHASSIGLSALLVGMASAFPVVRPEPPPPPDPTQLTFSELATSIEHASSVLGTRLLALPEGYEDEHAELLALPNTGAARLVTRGQYELHPKREGGSFYSFTTRDHDYDREPDIGLGFNHDLFPGRFGLIWELGDVDIIDATRETIFASVEEGDIAVVSSMLTPVSSVDDRNSLYEAWHAALGARERSWCPAPSVNHTYLVRSRCPGEHDTLTAMRVTDVTDDGITFLWRTFVEWPTPRNYSLKPERRFTPSEAPRWMFELSTDALDEWQESAQTVLTSRLFTSSPSNVTHLFRPGDYEHLLSNEFALAQDCYLDELPTSGEVGSYFDFRYRAHGFDGDPDLHFDDTVFSALKAGGIVRIGPEPLENVDAETPPENLEGTQLNRFHSLVRQSPDALKSSPTSRAMNMSSARVVVGDTYILRVIDHGRDMLFAFTVTDESSHGVRIEWRDLRL